MGSHRFGLRAEPTIGNTVLANKKRPSTRAVSALNSGDVIGGVPEATLGVKNRDVLSDLSVVRAAQRDVFVENYRVQRVSIGEGQTFAISRRAYGAMNHNWLWRPLSFDVSCIRQFGRKPYLFEILRAIQPALPYGAISGLYLTLVERHDANWE